MLRLRRLTVYWMFVCCLVLSPVAINNASAADRFAIVIDEDAPALERYAATELSAQIQKLYSADVTISSKLEEPRLKKSGAKVMLLGSPRTNSRIKQAIGDAWPALSDQGHFLRTVRTAQGTALIVGGESPVATLWAAYELGYQLGIRYLLHGDLYPAEPKAFNWESCDMRWEPDLRLRTWRTINDFPIGPEAWGLEEQQRVLRQLAKLKFNRILLTCYPWQPFVDFEFRGVRKQSAMLWYGWHYPIDSETAGRAAFRGVKEFTNPDFSGKESYEEKTAAGIRLAQGIMHGAHELGMSTAIAISPLEFPREFASVLPDAKVVHGLESLTIGPGPRQPPDDPNLQALVKTQIRAYIDTYPEMDGIYFSLPEFPDWSEHHEAAWKKMDERTGVGQLRTLEQLTTTARDRGLIASGARGVQALQGNLTVLEFFYGLMGDSQLLRRKDGLRVRPTLIGVDPALFPLLDKILPVDTSALHFIDYTAKRSANHQNLLQDVAAKAVPSSLILTLADDNVGVLPQLATTHLHSLVSKIRELHWEGFSTRYWILGDLDPSACYLSQASFRRDLTPAGSFAELLEPIGAPDVVARIVKSYALIEQATEKIDEHDIGFTFPVPGVVMKHYEAAAAPPGWWKEVQDLYAGAMDETYRANQRCAPAGRSLTRYQAKRLEFAVHYISSIQAVRSAGLAKSQGDREGTIANLEKAVEALYNSLDALREVARDSCDLGIIAVLNEYGYRPLQRELQAQSDGS